MKPLACSLAAMALLRACSDMADPDNQARTEATNAVAAGDNVVAAATRNEAGAPATEGAGKAPPPPPRDEPIRNGQSRPAGPPPADEADQCGASRYQYLVGRPRSAIPAQPAGARWRVTCTGCPITMDYSPARLNIFYDSETERVEEVRCG
jgi:hypothetical protein